jgi:hypothetical protein
MKKLLTIALALGASVLLGMHAAYADCIRLKFENDSAKTIRYLYVSPSTFGGWGNDILGSDLLYSGDSGSFSGCFNSTDDNYDFRAIFSDGTYKEWRQGVNIVGGATVWVDSSYVLHWIRW